jgi:hypothetical protein
MPKTVKAKYLLGWMNQHEAVDALNACIFNPPLMNKKAIALWKQYRDKVAALPPRNARATTSLALTGDEKAAIAAHENSVKGGPQGQFFSSVMKVEPENLVIRQFHVITERAEQYAQSMGTDATRINHCLGIGLDFKGTLPPARINGRNQIAIDLPHAEFVPIPVPNGFTFKERDRYVTGALLPDGRSMLWSGYHRAYAILVLRQAGGVAAGAAPLLTVMTGMPDVQAFFNEPTLVRDSVFGDRPALLRDFFDEDLFISVNLRKKRAEGRIEQRRNNQLRAGVFLVNDES